MDITQLILDDHHEQRRLFSILEQISRTDTEVLRPPCGDGWRRSSSCTRRPRRSFSTRHCCRWAWPRGRASGVESETLDAIGDHNDIRDAIAEVARHEVGTDAWYAAVAAANLANSDHMAEEEREGLTDFRRLASLQRRHDLAVAFAAFEARHFAGVTPHDRDPAEYVREAEEDLRPPAGGSLSIGSLKST